MLRTSGLFQTHSYTIPITSVTEPVYLVLFSDVHWGSPGFCKKAWNEFKDWGKAHNNAYYIGNGDYIDQFRAHTQKVIRDQAEGEERQTFDDLLMYRVKEFHRELAFMGDRIIGLGEGNHGWQFSNGDRDSAVLAQMVGSKFLGVSAVVRVVLDYGGARASFLYYQHHGKGGGGTTAGATFNTVERLAKHVEGVTIYAMGDDHKRGIVPGQPKMAFFLDKKSGVLVPRERPQFFARTGSFVKSYDPGMANYVVDRGLGPTSLGPVMFEMRLRRDRVEGLHIGWKAIT